VPLVRAAKWRPPAPLCVNKAVRQGCFLVSQQCPAACVPFAAGGKKEKQVALSPFRDREKENKNAESERQRRVRAAATGWTRRMRRLHKTAHHVVKREMNWRAALNRAVIKNTPFLTAEKKRRGFGNGGK